MGFPLTLARPTPNIKVKINQERVKEVPSIKPFNTLHPKLKTKIARKKAIVFDTSSIITLALNGLLWVLEDMKKKFKITFYIPEKVVFELIEKPKNILRFKLEILMIKKLLKKKILEIFPSNKQIREEAKKIMKETNNLFVAKGKTVKIIHDGEADCLALANFLFQKGYKIALAVDERNTRLACENPKNIGKIMERKLHISIKLKNKIPEICQPYPIIRSSELLFIAYKSGIINLPTTKQEAIEALLYATKFSGCAISHAEITEAKKLV